MTYSVKEIYYTLQGEGAQTGRPAEKVTVAVFRCQELATRLPDTRNLTSLFILT